MFMQFLKSLQPSSFPIKSFSGSPQKPLTSSSQKKATPLGLPLSLFVLYVTSSANALILLILSLLDLGYLSLWTIPPLSIFTLISHFAFPLLAQAPRLVSSPSYFSTIVVCAYTLAAGWFIAFVAAIIIAAMADSWEWSLEAVHEGGGAATVGTQVVQVIFSLVETVLLVTFGVKAHRRVIDKGEPESWRPPVPEQDKSMVGLSTVVFDSSHREWGGGSEEDGNMKQIDLTPAEN